MVYRVLFITCKCNQLKFEIKKKKKKYSDEDLEKALKRIRNGETYYKVAKETAIPMEILRYNIVHQVKRRGSGRPTALSKEEKDVVQSAIFFAEAGFPMDIEQM